ncbi:PfkB family carbohydrate kinase [Kineothrix sedimenti]|uniref:PfkB family carbohydrate kinase n=1 Tax=Kineothrix sedimenti TaxID=3123317 RepID=A0ABZ3EZ43_9FIRM
MMAEHNIKVLGFGDNVVDMYEHTKTMYPGGNCVNLCAYATIFGVEKSAYMGYFGNDEKAEWVIKALDDLNIETVKCKQLEGENGWSKIDLENGERVFVDWNDGGIRGKTPFILDRFDLEYIKQFDFVHSGNYCFTEEELPKIKDAGVKISFDFSDDSTDEYYKKIIPYVDYAFCSFDGCDEAVKEHLKMMTEGGATLAAASRGSKGCILYDGNEYYVQAAVPIVKVVDTMGAGDSLIASFTIGYADKLKKGMEQSEAIRTSLAEAAAFASKICECSGAFGYGTKYE